MERQKKRAMKELNEKVWMGEKGVFPVQASLDSNMKKNTAFIKRLRTAINGAGVSTFLQEIRTLSLHKYLTEIVSACFEGLCRLKTAGEVAAGVEVVSALHQRFGPEEFTCYLGWLLGRSLSTPDKAQLKALPNEVRDREEKERIARQRILLRVATELWLVGVLRSLEDVMRPEEAGKARDSGKGLDAAPKAKINGVRSDVGDPEPFPLEVLKDMLSHDREHVNLPLVVLFVKTFAWDVLGSHATVSEGRKHVAEDGATMVANSALDSATSTDEDDAVEKDVPLTSPELQQRFRNIIQRYFDDVKAHLVRDQKQLGAQSKRNAEAYVKSGEVFEDRQANYEKTIKAQERLVASAQTLADVLGVDMPDLTEKDEATAGIESSIGLVKTGDYMRSQAEGAGIWEDEDERRFYENLTDLKDRVPGILLEDGKKKKVDADEQVGKKIEEASDGDQKADVKSTDADDSSTAIANKTVGAQVDALLARLHELTGRDQVDQLAIDFCFLNSKASRNRLLKSMEEIPRGRTDLLPLYARLIATLGRYLTDVPQSIITYLNDEFRSLQRRKSKDFLGQVRMVNVRYIAELTKFGVVPEHVIFHCLKVSLDDFSRMNIEIIATLLENCGRYLLRNPDTSPRMTSFLETLQRKKAAQHLGQQERMLVENAIYYVDPPKRAAIQQKERTTLDLYVRHMIYMELSKKTLEKVIKQIRKLHWEEAEVVTVLRKIFTKPSKIKFSNVHLLAVMLGALYRFHADFAISVIDDVLERVTVGLETNDFKYNQRRIAEVKYLGELYTYRLVDSAIIFDTLYTVLNYGHEGGYAQPGRMSQLDLPDDYFRIRLVAALLETCGMYFEKGTLKKKLDFYLAFLQLYINVKDPLPMDMEFVVQDLYSALRPQWHVVLGDLSEASRVFAEACKQNYSETGKAPDPEDVDEAEADGSDDAPMNSRDTTTIAADAEDGEDIPQGADPTAQPPDSDEEEHIVVTRPEEERDPEADADFDRELAKLMAESAESRRTERKPIFDVPLPLRRTARSDATSHHAAEDSGGEAPALSSGLVNGAAGKMKFALLSRKGNRQQTRSIDLPSDSGFAVAMRTQQEAERAEQQRIKSLVLNYDLMDDDPHDGEAPSFHYLHLPGNSGGRKEARVRVVGTGSLNRSLRGGFGGGGRGGRVQHETAQQKEEELTIKGGKDSHDDDGGVTQQRGKKHTSTHEAASRRSFTAPTPPSTPLLLERPLNVSAAENALTDQTGSYDSTLHGGQPPARGDKSGSTRNKQRARKLDLKTLDWYVLLVRFLFGFGDGVGGFVPAHTAREDAVRGGGSDGGRPRKSSSLMCGPTLLGRKDTLAG
ncbi:mRNA decay protein [Friedmanniomyces endolithicus]|uniref:mRNA decay protein n=1 Tax=Friedmanniomyces endolithicus TaxID=329885 RepID=A0AAN6K2M9_9PEZI|nr:mRNA decay protein [Friedmanniomyces endolithicus]KAK0893587.1 mRNA decay protein [Friedmanniomyces endolithicus]KAK0963924.1 mRNA decay protein [Friedmanniomyces endolithicus]